MVGEVSLIPDRDRILEMLRHELGPELWGLLGDSKITNIHANEDGSVFVRAEDGAEVGAGLPARARGDLSRALPLCTDHQEE